MIEWLLKLLTRKWNCGNCFHLEREESWNNWCNVAGIDERAEPTEFLCCYYHKKK